MVSNVQYYITALKSEQKYTKKDAFTSSLMALLIKFYAKRLEKVDNLKCPGQGLLSGTTEKHLPYHLDIPSLNPDDAIGVLYLP